MLHGSLVSLLNTPLFHFPLYYSSSHLNLTSMKNSSPSSSTSRWLSTTVIILLMAAASTESSRILALQPALATPSNFVHHQRPRLRNSFPPPPGGDGDEIDPRYGIEKRLVPSGPNPLHN